ncbi:hypothetical protein GW923_04545 [Candidatus Pacearchaeota archaeon]|nr:hypothetical protein [Candidatus Pacearchaeota archaeon]
MECKTCGNESDNVCEGCGNCDSCGCKCEGSAEEKTDETSGETKTEETPAEDASEDTEETKEE